MAINRKDDIKTVLCEYGDTSGDKPTRMSIGTPGQRIEYNNEMYETGVSLRAPGYTDGMLAAVGEIMGVPELLEFDLTTSSDPFPLITYFDLPHVPWSDAHLLLFKNGSLMHRDYGGSNGYNRSGKGIFLSAAAAPSTWYHASYWADTRTP